MSDLDIIPYAPDFRDDVVTRARAAWAPVFAQARIELPSCVYEAFYPNGWKASQAAEVASLLDSQPDTVWLASKHNNIAGFVDIRIHPEDQMSEIHIRAASPDGQRQGIGRTFLGFAENEIRDRGMKMVMVETVGDNGHEPDRRTHKSFGGRRGPVAHHFKPL